MSHSSFGCFLRRVIVPIFVYGAASQANVPKFDALSEEEKKVLLEYVFEQHNLDDFYNWIETNCLVQTSKRLDCLRGSREWRERFKKGENELVAAPTPSIILTFLLAFTPLLFAVLFFGCAYIGIKSLF